MEENKSQSGEENSTGALASNSKNSVRKIVSLFGLGGLKKSRDICHMSWGIVRLYCTWLGPWTSLVGFL